MIDADAAIAANTAKIGYSDTLVAANAAVAANTAKVAYNDTMLAEMVATNAANIASLLEMVSVLENAVQGCPADKSASTWQVTSCDEITVSGAGYVTSNGVYYLDSTWSGTAVTALDLWSLSRPPQG